jgi:hypothetical protein
MKTQRRKQSVQRRSTWLGLAVIVVLATAAASLPSVFAVPGSDFESTDGNLVVDNTRDWQSLGGQVAIGQDKPTGATDDSLGVGSKDDHPTPTVTSGSIPNNKSDLDRLYVATENLGAFPGEDFLYLAFTRNNTLGTANISFELNKLDQPAPPPSGPWALNRSAGDLLILFDFARGGKPSDVKLSVSTWVTSGDPKQVCEAGNTVPCWGKVTVLGSDVADGSVNFAPITDPLNGDKALPELTFGEAAINLTASGLLKDLCAGFGSAMVRSRSSAAFNSELKDFIAPIDVSIFRSPDPTNANASGDATGAKVVTGGGPTVVNLPDPPGTDPSVSTSQTGPGSNTSSASQDNPRVPSDGSVLSADLIRATSTSSVAGSGARQTSTAEAVDVNIMNGLVHADFVRGVGITNADSRSSGISTTGSTIKGLVVNGTPQNNVAPNSRIGLPALSYGEGSYVALYEVGPDPTGTGTTSQPGVGQAGAFAADVQVTMIRVHITDDNGAVPGGNPAEIIVSRAKAHSDFPGIRCHDREVSGHAFVASETTEPPLAPTVVGYVAIPRSGGEQSQHLESATLGGGSVLTAGTSDSFSSGTLEAGTAIDPASEANSHAQTQDVCALKDGLGNCTVRATVLKAASHSRASASSRASDPADTTVVASAQGQPVAAQGPNTTQTLDGLGFVTFNEQICDGGASLDAGCAKGSSTGLTVRGIHIVITAPDNPLGLRAGTEVIITEAHSDASFVQ